MSGRKKTKAAAAAPAADRRKEVGTRANGADEQAKIDEALAESFPASDPPAWTLGHDREELPDRRKKK